MKCPKFNSENKEGAKFFGKCGAKLTLICPNCNSENDPENSYCNECGYQIKKSQEILAIDYSEPQSYTPKHLQNKILTTRRSLDGERKIVSVLFADIANYTSMSEKLDPEEVHQIIDGAFGIRMKIIGGVKHG